MMTDTTHVPLCFIAGLVLLSFVLVIAWIRLEQSRCPDCRRFGARQDLGKELLGISKQTRRFWSSLNDVPLGRIVPHEKYRVYHRCRHCGHEWTSVDARKL